MSPSFSLAPLAVPERFDGLAVPHAHEVHASVVLDASDAVTTCSVSTPVRRLAGPELIAARDTGRARIERVARSQFDGKKPA
jgi:hypothetical protein